MNQVCLNKNYGRLTAGVSYNINEEGRDWYKINGHYVPKILVSKYEPAVNEDAEYEDFV